jgi:nitrogen fixation protein NifQ
METKIVQRTNLDTLEYKVTYFLQSYAKDNYAKDEIAPHIAQKSLEMNHLYQDLGFKNRIQMGKYMNEHFPKLAELKPAQKLWKKFIYDSINEVAPACEDCKDQITCFNGKCTL